MKISSIFNKVLNRAYNEYYSQKDFKTARKILIIESDDWGSIRIPSKEVHDTMIRKGYQMDSRPYERFDTLESNIDLEELINILVKYRDFKGNHPIITLNTLVANPDFEKIKSFQYTEYFYESILDTYKSYLDSDNVYNLLLKGTDLGVFKMQSHGREHFNYELWLNDLKNGNKDSLTAFDYGMCGIFPKENPSQGNKNLIALKNKNSVQIVSEGLKMFEEIWGYKSDTFIAPCYTWNYDIEDVLKDNAVKLIQSVRLQKSIDDSSIIYHYNGEKAKNSLFYSIRNCTFEPSTIDKDKNVDEVLRQIEICFQSGRIAIISSHRINYVGRLSVINRERNLRLLDKILEQKHP